MSRILQSLDGIRRQQRHGVTRGDARLLLTQSRNAADDTADRASECTDSASDCSHRASNGTTDGDGVACGVDSGRKSTIWSQNPRSGDVSASHTSNTGQDAIEKGQGSGAWSTDAQNSEEDVEQHFAGGDGAEELS